MRGWDMLFFKPGTFTSRTDKSAEWNRGAYLVEGPGHCGACHTPKNFLGADKAAEALDGGKLQNWFAPNITNDQHLGVGSWTVDEIAEYLKTGRNVHSGAAALMSEVVRNSTSKMSDSDLHAMAIYLKDVNGKSGTPPSRPRINPPTIAAGRFMPTAVQPVIVPMAAACLTCFLRSRRMPMCNRAIRRPLYA